MHCIHFARIRHILRPLFGGHSVPGGQRAGVDGFQLIKALITHSLELWILPERVGEFELILGAPRAEHTAAAPTVVPPLEKPKVCRAFETLRMVVVVCPV